MAKPRPIFVAHQPLTQDLRSTEWRQMHPGCHAPRVERKIRELKEYVRGQIKDGV
jgi:hypothetical protein